MKHLLDGSDTLILPCSSIHNMTIIDPSSVRGRTEGDSRNLFVYLLAVEGMRWLNCWGC
jgi:hypothetical protein